MNLCEPFLSGAPHAYFGAHRLKSAVICDEQDVGQTMNKFSTRCLSHCSNLKKQDQKVDKDQMTLSRQSVLGGILSKPLAHKS